MATNNFKAFGIGAGANVTSQADYEALAALLTGFQSGKASSAQINKALRQGTVMAAVLAQFTADKSGNDVLDNGNTMPILTNFIAALKANAALANANYFLDTGVANAMVITPSPAITSLVDGQVFDICCAAPNTGAVTIKVNNMNAFPLWGNVGNLQGGEISAAGGVITVIWSASSNAFFLLAQNTGGGLPVSLATRSNHALSLGQFNGLFVTHGSANVFTTIDIAGVRRLMEGTASGYFNNGSLVFTLPLAFAGAGYTLIATDVGIGVFNLSSSPISTSQVQLYAKDGAGNLVTGNVSFKYIAVGPAS